MRTQSPDIPLLPERSPALTAPRIRPWAARYELIRLHCEGGLGRVYVVHDRELDRDVALKELRPQHYCNSFAKALFTREARVTCHLEHPNIVPVYDQGTTACPGSPYYTMRFVRGATLSRTIDQYHLERMTGMNNRRRLRRLMEILIETCQAVAYAHSRGVIHRDLKPANVLIGEFGEVVVLDWGSAKIYNLIDDEPCDCIESDHPDYANAIVGTPAYMAPEQALGHCKQIGEAADVYGLGAILYDILTGSPPHGTRSTQHLTPTTCTLEPRHARPLTLEPPDFDALPENTPPELAAICRKMLAESPGERYPAILRAVDDIEHWLADDPVSVHRQAFTQRCSRWTRRHRTLAVVALVIMSAVAAFGASLFRLTLVTRQDQLASALRAKIHCGDEMLLAFESLFLMDATIDRNEFHTFASALLQSHPELQAVEWISTIAGADRTTHESVCAAASPVTNSFTERAADGSLVPARTRSVYFPIMYVEPYTGNEEALCFDIGSSPDRRRALDEACATGDIVATAPVSLVQSIDNYPGILAFSPVDSRLAGTTPNGCQGFVLMVYDVNRLLTTTWDDLLTDHYEIEVYDVTDRSNALLLWRNHDRSAGATYAPAGQGSGLFRRVSQITVWQRTWEIHSRPTVFPITNSSRSQPEGVPHRRPWPDTIIMPL